MRQGCILTLTFFNTCIDWVIGDTVEENDFEISLGEVKITDLLFIIIFTIEKWENQVVPDY